MRVSKNITKIISLFVLLLILASTPIFLTNIENKNLFQKVYTTPLIKEQEIIKEFSTPEKLEIIVTTFFEGKNTPLVEKDMLLKGKELENFSESVLKELKILQEMNVLPQFSLDQDFTIEDVTKRTLLDENNLQRMVSVEEASFNSSDISFYILRDADTSKLYYFSISLRNISKLDYSALSPQSFFSYLDLPSENVSYKKGDRSGFCFYKSKDLYFIYKYKYDEDYIFFELYH